MKKIWNWFKGILGTICLLVAFIAAELLIFTNHWVQWFPWLMLQTWALSLVSVIVFAVFLSGCYVLRKTEWPGRSLSRVWAIPGCILTVVAFAILNAKGLGYLNGYIPGMNLPWFDGFIWFLVYFALIGGILLMLWAKPREVAGPEKKKEIES